MIALTKEEYFAQMQHTSWIIALAITEPLTLVCMVFMFAVNAAIDSITEHPIMVGASIFASLLLWIASYQKQLSANEELKQKVRQEQAKADSMMEEVKMNKLKTEQEAQKLEQEQLKTEALRQQLKANNNE